MISGANSAEWVTEECRACRADPEIIGHVLSKCSSHEWGLMKERHDSVLYVLVRVIMRALGLRFPSPYKTLVGAPNLVCMEQMRRW